MSSTELLNLLQRMPVVGSDFKSWDTNATHESSHEWNESYQSIIAIEASKLQQVIEDFAQIVNDYMDYLKRNRKWDAADQIIKILLFKAFVVLSAALLARTDVEELIKSDSFLQAQRNMFILSLSSLDFLDYQIFLAPDLQFNFNVVAYVNELVIKANNYKNLG
jgi:hypothetical protein